MAAAAILFLLDLSQKVIRSEIPREQPYQFISYGAHKIFRRPFRKMAAYGLVQKKTNGMNCPGT